MIGTRGGGMTRRIVAYPPDGVNTVVQSFLMLTTVQPCPSPARAPARRPPT